MQQHLLNNCGPSANQVMVASNGMLNNMEGFLSSGSLSSYQTVPGDNRNAFAQVPDTTGIYVASQQMAHVAQPSSQVASEVADGNEQEKNSEDDKPKRPLSAYNFFFQDERRLILESRPVRAEGKPRRSHGKMGFATMARTIADRWNKLEADDKKVYEIRARKEKLRYKKELAAWKKRQNKIRRSSKTEKKSVAKNLNSNKMSQDTQVVPPPSVGIASSNHLHQEQILPLVTNQAARPLNREEETRLHNNINRLANVMDEECMSLFLDMFQS
uniref:HMG box domain-containing protein n=1 Tax=Entomoneis paludosa TaxID=265537 RepID=A0A6U2WQT8_9STRA